MALCKPIKQPNGITLSYHYLAKLEIEPNQRITILVHSYLNPDARQYDKDYASGKIEGEPEFPYTDSSYYSLPYIDEFTVRQAYEWIKKNVPEFEGATDC